MKENKEITFGDDDIFFGDDDITFDDLVNKEGAK